MWTVTPMASGHLDKLPLPKIAPLGWRSEGNRKAMRENLEGYLIALS